MSHLLLIGVGPLPCYETDHLYGFGIRAWQFALPLLAADHRLTLVTCEFGCERENQLNIHYRRHPSVWGEIEHIPLPEPRPRNLNVILTRLDGILADAEPDGIIAAGSTIATNLAACMKTNLPIWMDMFGDLFAEAQAKAPFSRNPQELDYFHRILSRVLLRGDRFSVVSEMQRGAAIGQLGLMGRLNQFTLGEELVHTVPCAMDGEIAPVRREPVIRGKETGPRDFLLLCSGGFNTWADVETLFAGIEEAMDQNRFVRCVVTGGQITGHHEEGFNRFRSLISKSAYESRFHLLGWLSNEEVSQITLECDMGVNVDLPIYESTLGSRNRFLYWMQHGLPILTTETTEISLFLSQNDLAIGVPTGSSKLIARRILEAAANPAALRKRATRAKRLAFERLTFAETVQPLLEWAKDPERASDNIERELLKGRSFNQIDEFLYSWAFQGMQNDGGSSIPSLPKPVIHTRPQGKSLWRRLWGA